MNSPHPRNPTEAKNYINLLTVNVNWTDLARTIVASLFGFMIANIFWLDLVNQGKIYSIIKCLHKFLRIILWLWDKLHLTLELHYQISLYIFILCSKDVEGIQNFTTVLWERVFFPCCYPDWKPFITVIRPMGNICFLHAKEKPVSFPSAH